MDEPAHLFNPGPFFRQIRFLVLRQLPYPEFILRLAADDYPGIPQICADHLSLVNHTQR